MTRQSKARKAAEQWRSALGNLNTWKRGNQRAVHKPLLSLILLARAEAGGDNSVRFQEIHEQLHNLLDEFGPQRKSHHPEYPFWHLQSDGFWHVEEAEALPLRKAGNSPSPFSRVFFMSGPRSLTAGHNAITIGPISQRLISNRV